jgi:PKD repeat protein
MHTDTIITRKCGLRSPNLFLIILLCALLFLPQPGSGNSQAEFVLTANIIHTPTARFTANITEGPAPLPVEFTDLSAGTPTSWMWEFGDGTNSTDQNPTHTYTNGMYTVNLTVTNAAGTTTIVWENYITALQGPVSPSQSQSSSVSGGSGGGGGLSASSQQPARENLLAGIQQPEQGPSGRGQLAPPQSGLISWTIDLSPYSQYMYTDSSGMQGAIIDRKAAEQSGATISVSGKTVEIIRPAFTLSITAGTMTEVNGVIRADTIQSIQLATTPIDVYTEGVGQVTSSFTAGLASLPSNAGLTMTIAEPVNPSVAEAFRRAVADEGDEIQAIAYTLTVQKTNIAATLPATITMSIPAEWVTSHGGIGSIVIGRIADDKTTTILKTSFSGYDQNGNMEFVANSPDGLSVFALIATRGSLQTRMEQPGFMSLILQNPVLSTILGTLNTVISTTRGLLVVILIVVIVVLVICGNLWRKRRTRTKKPGRQDAK